ncbi:MAG: DUF4279 domain-containing protein [Ruminococcus flavefaciens]|nr:DUF4279 domain-containing protein [Ruminococcus flavefaciens]MCM1228855.1 DUF4279 domain-containing protein [Ruminococcus flavefaciens]
MKKSEHTKCYTYFRMVGNFNPDTVSEMLCLVPEQSHKIGDTRKNGTKYDFAVWHYGCCEDYDICVANQMQKTISNLLSKTDILKEIKKKYDVSFYLEVVPVIVCNEAMPCLAPSLDVMQFCCDTQTEIDIDLYADWR